MLWEHPHRSGITVYLQELAVADDGSGLTGANDCRDAELPRHDGAVAEDATGIGDYGRGGGEQGRPGSST